MVDTIAVQEFGVTTLEVPRRNRNNHPSWWYNYIYFAPEKQKVNMRRYDKTK